MRGAVSSLARQPKPFQDINLILQSVKNISKITSLKKSSDLPAILNLLDPSRSLTLNAAHLGAIFNAIESIITTRSSQQSLTQNPNFRTLLTTTFTALRASPIDFDV